MIDVVATLAHADPGATIYVSPPASPRSESIVCVEADDGRSPAGFDYLLEVDIALEVLEVWVKWRGGRTPTAAEAVRAVIHYARYDAYEPGPSDS